MKDELVDVLDENGQLTGKTIMKSEAHDKGLWHPEAWVWVFDNDGYVLLQLRSKSSWFQPGKLDISVAGHTEAGMTNLQTAVKEMQEEIGLIVDPTELEHVQTFKAEDEISGQDIPHRVVTAVYFYQAEARGKLKLEKQDEEVDELVWKRVDEFAADLGDDQAITDYVPNTEHYKYVIKQIRKRLNDS